LAKEVVSTNIRKAEIPPTLMLRRTRQKYSKKSSVDYSITSKPAPRSASIAVVNFASSTRI
jgi:hypothetical protein